MSPWQQQHQYFYYHLGNQQFVGVGDNRIDFMDIFSPDNYLPIEINVPDTFMGFWQGVNSAWETASGYFSSMNGEDTPRFYYIFNNRPILLNQK